jgi:hypothetical protein
MKRQARRDQSRVVGRESWWRRVLLALATASSLLSASPAWSWNNQGHMATGAIVYDVLARSDPGALSYILAFAKFLPQRDRMDAALQGLAGSAHDRVLFEYLARWPDDVRGGPFDHPDWHYAVQVVTLRWGPLRFTVGKARQAYDASMATLQDPRASLRDKAIATAWIIHIVGDIHQPLHTATRLVAPDFAMTDRAGTSGFVRLEAGGEARTLHDAWDSAADLPGPEAAAADALAARLEEGGVISPAAVASSSGDYDALFREWWRESYALALSSTYAGEGRKEAPRPKDARLLSQAYQARARRIAEGRIRLSGWRAAASLVTALTLTRRPDVIAAQ